VTLAAVSDAGPLIHLAEIDSLELLVTFDTLLVPERVHTEVDAGGVPMGWPTSRTNSSKPMKAESDLKNWMSDHPVHVSPLGEWCSSYGVLTGGRDG
jgi:hypothetical protein